MYFFVMDETIQTKGRSKRNRKEAISEMTKEMINEERKRQRERKSADRIQGRREARNISTKIEIIYEPSCPNAHATKQMLHGILSELGLSIPIDEINKLDPAAPLYSHSYASPTILWNGKDLISDEAIAGPLRQGDGRNKNFKSGCRLYKTESGLAGIPPKEVLRKAILDVLEIESA